ncbi:MAG: hypothetical protein GY854_25010 [Deltaproteobacteria bacterium]|nr:hypothetical protein [Deltaproteobacteria bacterium]
MSTKSFLLVTLIAGAVTASCGPSMRRTYQSDNAFERCFDKDYNPATDKVDKEVCWSTWLEKHVYNQEDDKTRYAELRLKELSDGISIPGPPGPAGAFDKRPAPPRDANAPDEGSKSVPAAQKEEPPSAPCETSCKKSREACRSACETDAGVNEDCARGCDAGYRACMKSCFEDA